MLADNYGTDIDELIYEPTGLTFLETMQKYAKHTTVSFECIPLPSKALHRASIVHEAQKEWER